MKMQILPAAMLLGTAFASGDAMASSHREAPAIAGMPRVDGTDFYMFRSYEPGRSAYVTFIANYIPLQDAYGGPNYFNLDPSAVYDIRIDNDGSAKAALTFRFRFTNTYKNFAVNAGGKNVAVPLINIGPIDAKGTNLNVVQSYTIEVIRKPEDEGSFAGNATLGGSKFFKPADNIGKKSIADYAGYADKFIEHRPRQTRFKAAAPGADTWEVTGPDHAQIYNTFPAEYTRRAVVHFERMAK